MSFKFIALLLLVVTNVYAEDCRFSIEDNLLTVCVEDTCEFQVLDLEYGLREEQVGPMKVIRNKILMTEIPMIYMHTEFSYVGPKNSQVQAFRLVQQQYCDGSPCFQPMVLDCGSVTKYFSR